MHGRRALNFLCMLLIAGGFFIGSHDAVKAEYCILDRCADKQDAPLKRNDARVGRIAPGDFDFFVLALSWSPGFCLTQGSGRQQAQCDGGGEQRFVVHGLWPQNERGFPADCDRSSRLPAAVARDAAQNLYPDEGLARYEWGKHGTCTGWSPTEYIGAARQARDQVTIPSLFNGPGGERVSGRDIVKAFVDANRGLRADMVAVACPRNVLTEVRLCLTKDLRGFRSCPDVVRSSCRGSDILLPASR